MQDGVTVVAALSACGEDEVVTDLVAAPKPVVEVDTGTWTYRARNRIDGTPCIVSISPTDGYDGDSMSNTTTIE